MMIWRRPADHRGDNIKSWCRMVDLAESITACGKVGYGPAGKEEMTGEPLQAMKCAKCIAKKGINLGPTSPKGRAK